MKELAFVVEDDEDLAFIFTEALNAAEFECETIRDGGKASERLAEATPRLVILDMHLPHVSGADLLAQIRADERLTGTIVILATADARMGEALSETADFVLIKPITFTQLRDLAARLHRS